VGVAVGVAVFVGVGVAVFVGVTVSVGVAVFVGVTVSVGVAVFVGVAVSVGMAVSVGVAVSAAPRGAMTLPIKVGDAIFAVARDNSKPCPMNSPTPIAATTRAMTPRRIIGTHFLLLSRHGLSSGRATCSCRHLVKASQGRE